MKNRFIKQFMAVVLAVLMIFSVCACAGNSSQTEQNPKNGVRKMVTVEKPVYVNASVVFPLSVAHYENEPEILYVEIKSIIKECLQDLICAIYPGMSYAVEETDKTVKVTRENGSYCVIDFVKDTIYFSNIDTFAMNGLKVNPYDLLSNANLKPDGSSMFFQRDVSLYTPGRAVEYNLAERNITLDINEGKKYIPLQTFNDVFTSIYDINIAYNGQSLFLFTSSVIPAELEPIYYLDQVTQRTDALAEFNYNELCLFLDMNYGLKKEHGINESFAKYFETIGLKDKLLSNDPIEYFNAFGTFCFGYIADSHSSISSASPYLAEKEPSEGRNIQPAPEVLAKLDCKENFETTRRNYLGDNIDSYQKVGNTAYVTFDEFTLGLRTSYDDMTKMNDVIDIIYNAHMQITQDSDIENVVIDLSCNGGGAVDSAVYLISWMLGYCDLAIYNSVTGGKAITSYQADVNLDGNFDSNDTISDKNLYCLVSPLSFSCGNSVPAILKESGAVTIIGQETGGGACFVSHGITADGMFFNISGARVMSVSKNGSFYNIDKGITPNVYLSKVDSFYNRTQLTQYINSLL